MTLKVAIVASALLWASTVYADAIRRDCPTQRLEYRVWLREGAEYIDVENPHVEHGQLIWQQYGGEVRQDAANLVKIEPLTPETDEAISNAIAFEIARSRLRARAEKDKWFQARGWRSTRKAEDWLEALYAAEQYVMACGGRLKK